MKLGLRESGLCRELFAYAAGAAFLWGAYWAVRLSYADHLYRSETASMVERAVRLAPGNPRYYLRWADLKEASAESADGIYDQAVKVSPYDPEVWMRAGLNEEMNGDYATAEQDLLHASQLSKLYQPRWSLANFYFRRGKADQFWYWIHSALECSAGEHKPAFDLCWRMTQKPDVIMEKAMPEDRPAVIRDYLSYLIITGRLDATQAVARELAGIATNKEVALLLLYVNNMIGELQYEAASEVWNTLCARRLLPYPPLEEGRLTNGDFTWPLRNGGFDWYRPCTTGISCIGNDDPRWLRLIFSGEQPEHCGALEQLVRVTPGTDYVLTFRYDTECVAPNTGLRWHASDAEDGHDLTMRAPDLASPRWTEGRFLFRAGPATRWTRLSLVYERTSGTTRIDGRFFLSQCTLTSIPRCATRTQ